MKSENIPFSTFFFKVKYIGKMFSNLLPKMPPLTCKGSHCQQYDSKCLYWSNKAFWSIVHWTNVFQRVKLYHISQPSLSINMNFILSRMSPNSSIINLEVSRISMDPQLGTTVLENIRSVRTLRRAFLSLQRRVEGSAVVILGLKLQPGTEARYIGGVQRPTHVLHSSIKTQEKK